MRWYFIILLNFCFLGTLVGQKSTTTSEEAQPPTDSAPIPTEEPKIDDSTEIQSSTKSVVPATFSPSLNTPLLISNIILALTSGGLLAYFLILRSKQKTLSSLRDKVLSESDQVPLLTEEALEMISGFRGSLKKKAEEFDRSIKTDRESSNQIVREMAQATTQAQTQTTETVDAFKESLNETLGNIQKLMVRFAEDAKKTSEQTSETREFAKNVAEVTRNQAARMEEVDKGYQLSLLGPLLSDIVQLRDDLIDARDEANDAQQKERFEQFQEQVRMALSKLGVEETTVPDNPLKEEFPSQLWEPVGAPVITDIPEKHETVERIHRKGYLIRTPEREPCAIRKAVVVLNKFEQ